MPYIHPNDRERIDDMQVGTAGHHLVGPGELNFAFTRIALDYLAAVGANYQAFNDVVGALEGAKLELYRRHVAPYEDTKIAQNGDVK